MVKEVKCVLCGIDCSTSADMSAGQDQPIHTYECSACGTYRMAHHTRSRLGDRKGHLYVISGVTRSNWERSKSPMNITSRMISDDSEFESHFVSQEPKSVQGKIDLLMRHIARKSGKPGDDVHIAFASDYPIAFCHDSAELRFYIRHLAQGGLLLANAKLPEGAMSLTVQGWEKMEQLQKPNIMSKQAFVAMSFDDSMNEVYEKGIKPLEDETGFNMFRVDKMQFTSEKVCDKVIIEIKKSRFVIADVSGHRNAVYYEAGYAMGMGLPVIWTCRRAEREGCSFDSRQYSHIFWQEIDDLRMQLGERILAAIGKG